MYEHERRIIRMNRIKELVKDTAICVAIFFTPFIIMFLHFFMSAGY